jgi:large subunit ribosomal protein L28
VLYRAGVSHDTDRFQGACMAQRCDICGKGPSVGHTISHAHKLTKRRWLPNLVSMRVDVAGTTRRLRVCTRCLKAGKVTKVI